MTVTYFGPEDVRALVPMTDAIASVRRSFTDLAQGLFEMPTRVVLSDGKFLVMTAHHRPSGSTIVKTLSLNFDSRTPAILGTVTWCNLDDSAQVVADAAAVTALRTGAVTGVATDLLAVRDAASCTVIGAGAQGADQARAVMAVRPIRELEIVDTDLAKAERLCDVLAEEFGGSVKVSASTNPDRAVEGKDVVCCATTSVKPLFRSESIASHTHVNAIGAFRPSMHEVPEQLLGTADVVVDEVQAVMEEAGEVIDAVASGVLRLADLTELGTALQSPGSPRPRPSVFKSVGIAVQDWAIGNSLAQAAVR